MANTKFMGIYDRLNSWQSFLAFSETLPNPDSILSSKNQTVAMYRNLISDSQILAATQAREIALNSFEYEITVDSNNKKDIYALDLVKENFKSINIEMLIQEMLEAIWLGYSPIETVTANDGKHVYYDKLIGREAENFAFDNKNNLRFLSKSNSIQGDLVITDGPDKQVEVISHRATHRNPYGVAQLSSCFWPAHFIRGDMKLWLSYIDRLGDSPVIIKTGSRDPRYRKLLLATIEDIKSSGGGVLGTDDVLEILKADKVATSTLFEKFRSINEAAISKVILGHSSALDAIPGKLGNDDSALVVRADIVEGDKKLIVAGLNRLFDWLVNINLEVDIHPVFGFKQDEDVKTELADRDIKLTNIGVEFKKEYISRTYGLQDDDFIMAVKQVLNPAIPPVPEISGSIVKKKDPVELAEEITSNNRPIDGLIEKSLKRVEKDFKEFVDNVSMAVNNAEEYEQAIADVIRADNRTKVNSEYTERAMMSVQTLGMAEVSDEMPPSTREALFAEETAKGITGIMRYPEARKFLTQKLAMSDSEYTKLSSFNKEYAFAVSGIIQDVNAQDILGKLVTALNQGYTYDTFKKSIHPDILIKNNLSLAFRQNMNTSYMAGRYDQMKRVTDYLPWWEYYTAGDDRVRDSHAVLNGTVRRHDDPFWNIWYPQNGYGCRCGVRALTQDQVDAMGINPGAGIPDYAELAKDEKILDVNIAGIHAATDKFLPTDGFRHNPAKVRTEWLDFLVKQNSNLSPGTRIILGKNNWQTQGLKDFKKMGYDTQVKLNKYTKETITKYLKSNLPKLEKATRVTDVFGKNVFIDVDKFIRHIGKEKSRFSLAEYIQKILQNPDEVWVNIQYDTEKKKSIVVRNYFKRLNGKDVLLVVHGNRGVNTVITIIDKGRINNERVGVLLKK